MVPAAGVEPARVISPTDFESVTSANSITPANIREVKLKTKGSWKDHLAGNGEGAGPEAPSRRITRPQAANLQALACKLLSAATMSTH